MSKYVNKWVSRYSKKNLLKNFAKKISKFLFRNVKPSSESQESDGKISFLKFETLTVQNRLQRNRPNIRQLRRKFLQAILNDKNFEFLKTCFAIRFLGL